MTAAFNIDNTAPTINVAGTVTLTIDVGLDGVASIGDTITYSAGTVGAADGDSWTVDLSAYGLSATAAPGAYVIIADNDDGAFSATETVTDNAGNTVTGAVTAAFNIDNTAPTVTDANIAISGATGTGGAYKISDTITATWDNSGTGDNNADISTVTVNFAAFGGGAAVAAVDDGSVCGDTASDNVYTSCYTIVAGAIDGTNLNVAVTATDDASNPTTTSDTTNAIVDTQAPVNGAITTTIDDGASKITNGDTVTYTVDLSAETDTIASVAIDCSNIGDTSTIVVVDDGTGQDASSGDGIYTAQCAAGNDVTLTSSDEGLQTVAITTTDDAGNIDTDADLGVTVDVTAPTMDSAQTKTITTIEVTFSEDIDHTTLNQTQFNVTGHTVSNAAENSPSVVTLTVDALGVDETPDVTYTQGTLADLAGNLVATTTVTADDGIEEPDTLTVTPSATTTNIGGNSVTITVTATVGGGNVADGTTINITTDKGSLDVTSNTTTNGVATFVLTPGTSAGTATVNATSYNVSGTTTVTFNPGLFGYLEVTAADSSIYANGSNTTITAQLQDQYGNNIAETGTVVSFTSTKGTITASAPTDSTGKATVTLTAGNDVESTVTVTANVGITSGAVTLEFTAVPLNDQISLVQGWNFVSIPGDLVAAQDTIGELFGGKAVLTYNPVNGWADSPSSGDDVKSLEGYWVSASAPEIITLTYKNASRSTLPVKSVYAGWNTIGHTSANEIKAETALASIDASYSHLITWDAASQSYGSPAVNGIASGQTYSNADYDMNAGTGYYLFMTANSTLSSLDIRSA